MAENRDEPSHKQLNGSVTQNSYLYEAPLHKEQAS